MKIKSVWFVSHYSMPPEYEMRVKTLRYAHYLGIKGVDCTIFSASTLHNTPINLIKEKTLYIERQYDDLKYVHIRCSDYTKTDLKRIINMEQFGYRFAKVAEKFSPPDVIVADTYCISYKPIYRYCKKHNIPFIVDVRDLWPQSIVEYLHFSPRNPIIRVMYKMETEMYIRAERIVFSMEGGYDYIRDRGLEDVIPRDKVYCINNGVDYDEFKMYAQKYVVEDEDLHNDEIFKVVYTGSIRKVNSVGVLLDAAKAIDDKRIKLLIWGDGDEAAQIKQRIVEERVDNVVLKGKVEKKYIPYITSHADLNLIHNNPSELFKYGISFNKLFDYLAAGKPTLSTFPCRYNPAVMFGAGEQIMEPSPREIARAIQELSGTDPSHYIKNCEKAAIMYDYKQLTNQLLNILESL